MALAARVIVDHFFPYRGLAPELPKQLPPPDQFAQQMQTQRYFMLQGKPAEGGTPRPAGGVTIFLLDSGGPYTKTSSELRGLLHRTEQKGGDHETIVVTDPEVIAKSNIMAVIKDAQAGGRLVQIYPYSLFERNLPQVPCVPPHRIISREEAMDGRPQKPSAFPQILASDPPVVWLGGRSGEFVEITRDSETAGEATVVRYIS